MISVLALAGVAAGCGGGDDSDSLTKAEFVKQASDVCLKVNKETQKNLEAAVQAQEGVPPSKQSEEQLVNNIVIPALEKQSEKLKELGAPEGDEDQIAAITDELDKVAKEAEENPVGVASQSDPFLKVDQMMKDYELEACRH
ncbi:MAG TPA: hypothetical protein VFY48_12040 [Solirubrobacterales bacterium]|nr:hypothetical protein [Solirubrobacterales bacterium]